jgi:DUF4097 and DUF4098 domain-containing protein YvlB
LKRHQQIATVLVVAMIATIPALAQNSRINRDGNGWVEEITGTLPQTRVLKVTTDIGSIQVNGSNDSDIKYTIRKHSYSSSEESARRAFQEFGVTASRRGDYAIIEGSWEGGHGQRFNADFILSVPRGVQLVKLNSDGGAINVAGIAGKLEAETGGGEVHLDDIAAAMAETGGGSINVGTASGELKLVSGGGSVKVVSAGANVNVETGGGSVWLGKAGSAYVETGGGSVKVDTCHGDARVQTGGGSIDLGDVNGPVSMETGGGGIHLSSAKGPVKVSTGGGGLELWKMAQGVRAETGAGGITAELVGTPKIDSSLETSAGDITVYIAPDVRVNIQAEIDTATSGHDIHSDFPELRISREGGDWGPKTITATGSLYGGGPVLKISTNMGSINIRRGKR